MARREYQRAPVGECECPECRRIADVREDKNKALYVVCLGGADQDGCGKLTPNTRHGQERLRARTRFFQTDEPAPATVEPENKTPDPEQAPATEKKPEPEQPRGFFDRLLNTPVV